MWIFGLKVFGFEENGKERGEWVGIEMKILGKFECEQNATSVSIVKRFLK